MFRFLLWSLVFGLAYTQAPLYYSNQNQYFLHGAAHAGIGHLNEDWLANTADPTPLFSTLVGGTLRFVPPYFFHIVYIVLIGIYFKALLSLYDSLTGGTSPWTARLLFATLLLVVHAGIVRLASVLLFGKDYPWFLQAGVAGQYVLGAMLQPSVFGVLIVLALALFAHDRPWLALTCSSLAAVMHSTYLLSAAFFTLGCLLVLARAGQWRRAFLLGLWSLALVTPVLVYNWRQFAPTSADTFAQAQHILAHIRIPHHAVVTRWLDGIAWAQVAWMALGIALCWGTRLFTVLATMFVLGMALSLAQVWTSNDTLALVFPWRVSVILMPVATTVVLTRLVQRTAGWLERRSPAGVRLVSGVCFTAIFGLAAAGVAIGYFGWGYHTNLDEKPLLAHVRDVTKPGEIYLLPVAIPDHSKAARGALSTAFTPAPTRTRDKHLIAIDLQSFRLSTGAPIVVDFKSIPYRDEDVLTWHERLKSIKNMYDRNDWDAADVRAALREWKATHIVTPADRPLRGEKLEQVYDDGMYRLYAVK